MVIFDIVKSFNPHQENWGVKGKLKILMYLFLVTPHCKAHKKFVYF